MSPGTGVGVLLARPALQFIGRVSYSWYLWHWPVLVFAGRLGLADSLAARAVLVVFSLGLAVATFHLIENPLRYHRALTRRPALALGLAAGLTLVVGAASGGFRLHAMRVLTSPEQVALATARDTRGAPAACMLGYLDVDRPTCEFGDTTSATTVVLFGDSHATQWLSAVERVALERGWRIRLAAKGDCPAPMVDVWSPVLRRSYEECSEWRRSVLARIAEWRPHLVFIASTHVYPLRPAAFHTTLDDWRDGLARVVQAIEPSGARIVVLRDTPRPGFEVPECLSRAAFQPVSRADSCAISSRAAIDTVVFAAEREALRSIPAVLHVDLTDRFCDDSDCPTVIGGIVVYKDTNHMTAAFSATLAGPLSRALEESTPRARPAASITTGR
jgi:hypothetical protein